MYGALLVVHAERMVAGWVLEERLGSGGFGEVWKARRRLVDLRRALKLIPILSEGAFESWRHEISRLEGLSHPNVVRFYDADIVSEGPYTDYAWIATELCERSLADELRRRDRPHLSPAECERLLEEMLAALSAAHTAGCVHRDVKPANILRHAGGAWKLADFGTARLVPTGATHPVTQVIGTLPYMSPAAHHGHQNYAADLYALGVIVQESLCGRRLHHRAEKMTDSEYLKFVLDNPPVVSRELPPRWQTVVGALIGRYGELDAAQLGEWLRTTRGAQPPPARNGSSPRPPGSPEDGSGTAAATGRTELRASAGAATGRTEVRAGTAGAATGRTEVGNGAAGTVDAAAAAAAGSIELRDPASVAARPSPPAPASPLPQRVMVPAPVRPVPPPRWRGAGAPPSAPPPSTPPRSQPPAAARPAMAPAKPSPVTVRRIGAALLDIVFVLVLGGVLGVLTVATRYDQLRASERPNPDDPCAEAADEFSDCEVLGDYIYVTSESSEIWLRQSVVVASALFVFVVMQGLTGRTPGKLAFGLRVLGPAGRRPGMRRAFLRTVLWVVDAFPYVLPLLALLVSAMRRDNRRVGDVVAGTYVVRSS